MKRHILAAILALGIAGCTVSPEYRAFVKAADGFFAAVIAPVTSAHHEKYKNEPAMLDVKLGELEDFRAALKANKQRVGADW